MSILRAIEPQKPVNSDMVEKLEQLLDEARRGDLESFIAGAFRPGKTWKMVFSGQFSTVEKVGMLACMQDDLMDSMKMGDA